MEKVLKLFILMLKDHGVVTGADIKTDGDVEVVNKDLHIATLDDNGKLIYGN